MPRLSIVIPTLGRAGSLREVLQGLARQQPGLLDIQQHPSVLDVELVICLDATAPEASNLRLPEIRAPHKIIRATAPGASAARNAGWRAARAPLILFLDDDIVPAPRLVAEHLAWHERHPGPEVGVLGTVRWSAHVRVTPFMRWLERGVLFDFGSISGTEAGWGRFYSCNVSMKRALLDRVGGFDEDEFPFLYEDLDLARRLSAHNFRLLYNKSAVGEHLKAETVEAWRGRMRILARAERRFVARYPDVRPYFYERFSAAARSRQVRGWWGRLAGVVPPDIPWIGPRVWTSLDRACWQTLAPAFLAEWDTAPR